MSRFYHLHVQTMGISDKQLEDTMKELGWCSIEQPFLYKNVLECDFEGNLYAGQLEKEAHNEIAATFRAINSDVKVRTRFTYMENLKEYGDSLD